MEKSEIVKVDMAMAQGKYVVVQVAPAVRAALGEEFGYPVGTPVTGKIPAAKVAKCIEAVESRLLDLKEGDSERAKQTALLNKLKALK